MNGNSSAGHPGQAEQGLSFATADLLDAHEGLQSCETQFESFGRRIIFNGRIRTVRCRHDNALVKRLLSEAGERAVLVVDGGGSLYSALVGDMLAAAGLANGWAGIVVHGAIRDAATIDTLDIGVKALGTNPRRSAKTGAGEVDVILEFGGVVWRPGEFLYGDRDGIVVSPTVL
jgi:regulator of ribonuclease activity A